MLYSKCCTFFCPCCIFLLGNSNVAHGLTSCVGKVVGTEVFRGSVTAWCKYAWAWQYRARHTIPGNIITALLWAWFRDGLMACNSCIGLVWNCWWLMECRRIKVSLVIPSRFSCVCLFACVFQREIRLWECVLVRLCRRAVRLVQASLQLYQVYVSVRTKITRVHEV